MNILLHCCCGPCACGVIPRLKELGHDFSGYFYNPNIHPFQEHKSRRLSFVQLMEDQQIPYFVNNGYPLEQWLANVADNPEKRCEYCYRSRLQATAALAKQLSFDAFSTTLLVSPYQKHQEIIDIAELEAKQFGVKFFYEDFRPNFRAGQNDARSLQLYMQKYCGCIYSEKDRYCK